MILNQGDEKRENTGLSEVDEEVDADKAPLKAFKVWRCDHFLFLRLLPVQKQENGGYYEESEPIVLCHCWKEGHGCLLNRITRFNMSA